MSPRNQMMKQNYKACTVGAKMGTKKGRAKPGKRSARIRAQNSRGCRTENK